MTTTPRELCEREILDRLQMARAFNDNELIRLCRMAQKWLRAKARVDTELDSLRIGATRARPGTADRHGLLRKACDLNALFYGEVDE